MKQYLLAFALLPLFAGVTVKGCDSKQACKTDCNTKQCDKCPGHVMTGKQFLELSAAQDRVDLPVEVRKRNYGPSCYHCSAINCCRIAGYEEVADEWPTKHGGPATTDRIAGILDKYNVRFAVCTNGDIKFLEWASRNRLACAITYYPSHAINIMYLTDTHAVLLDNNRTSKYIYVPRAEFENNWRNKYGGDAICVLPKNSEEHTGPMPPLQELVSN